MLLSENSRDSQLARDMRLVLPGKGKPLDEVATSREFALARDMRLVLLGEGKPLDEIATAREFALQKTLGTRIS